MAISRLMISWILDLDIKYKIVSESKSITELGPSDLMPGAQKLLASENQNLKFNKGSARDWYANLGLTQYTAFDIVDDPRSRKADLSTILNLEETWDIVTNFGTSEHVFNQSVVMKNCHDFAKVGGVILHVVPMSSGMNHGFYNYHPRFFLSLALANNYEVLDFRFVPFNYLQAEGRRKKFIYVKAGDRPLHIRNDLLLFLAKVRLICNLRNIFIFINPLKVYKNFFGGDYIFIALRKRSDGRFTEPVQINHEPLNRSDVVSDSL